MGAVERKDSGSHAAEPGSLRAYVYPPDADQVAYAIGRKCVDIDVERIRKSEKKNQVLGLGLSYVKGRIRQSY